MGGKTCGKDTSPDSNRRRRNQHQGRYMVSALSVVRETTRRPRRLTSYICFTENTVRNKFRARHIFTEVKINIG